MPNFLDENFEAETSPVKLDDLVQGTPLPTITLPKASMRNRAATTALLTDDPAKSVENYQMMVAEAEGGQDTMLKSIQANIVDNNKKLDMQGVMSILGDPSLPIEEKRKAIDGIKNSQFLNDTTNALYTRSLSGASKGENVEQEDSRLSSADAISEIYQARQDIQGLVNAHAANLPSADLETVGEMAALWVMPFGNNVSTGKIASGLDGGKQSMWKTIKNFALAGSTTADMKERLASIPPEKRAEFAKSLLSSIKDNSGIIFSNDNHFAQFDKASTIFEEGGYSGFDEFVDNVSPLLDIVGFGQAFRGANKAVKGVNKAGKAEAAGEKVFKADWEVVDDRVKAPLNRQLPDPTPRLNVPDQIRRIEMNSVTGRSNPASPAGVMGSANPEKARSMHETVFKAESESVAEGLYGTGKVDAIVKDVYPQATTETGAVSSKVADIDRNLRADMHVPPEIIDTLHNSGATYYTELEKAQARANIANDFRAAEGLTVNDAMSSFTVDGGRIKIGAVYGASEGSFLRAEDAIAQTKSALRNYGIQDSEIEILQKQGLDHVPVNLEDVRGVDGDYLVRVNTAHEIDPTDIANFEQFDVKRNFFDRISPLVSKASGSASRWLFDAASMLHPTYSGAASVASDATSRFDRVLLEHASAYSDKYVKLPAARKPVVDDYIREANYKGIKFDRADLIARGMSADEIDAVKSWRDFWDSHFYLENYDMVRSLNSQGYQMFRNKNTELYAKPIPKNQNIGRIYDPATDSVITHTKAEMDTLYNSGGSYAKLRRPTDFGGVRAEHMLVRNTPTEYLRKFRDSDQVLNYRDGYFQIQYKAPRFVDEIVRDASGAVEYTKAIAVAGDTAEAQRFAERMAKTTGKPIEDFKVRGDDRALRKDDDSWWDVTAAGGRIAQRHRGKLLEDGAGLNHLGDGSYIMNPVDSAVRAARSISGRTVNRPMLEAAKARFMAQYGDMLPSNGMGGRMYPQNVKQITMKGQETSSAVADARTTYEYINYLENGYVNGIDDTVKTFFNATADMLGKAGMSKLERGAMAASEINPSSLAKNSVFMAYIGSNIFRQWIVQPHQILRTFSYNPAGWTMGTIQKYSAEHIASVMGLGKAGEFSEFLKNSGLLDAVDKSNLVRGSLTSAADSTNKAVRAAGKAAAVPRKLGFDIGEQANLLGHAAAVFDMYKRRGKDLTNKAVRDQAVSEIRAISYEMNFAGDMVYNQTSAAMVLQFMQVPHKAFLQATNRRLPRAVRARMLAADVLLWGGPTILVGDILGVDILPDDPELKEFFTWGAESMMLNNMFNQLMDEEGEHTNIDFSSLAPFEMSGWSKFFTAMYEGGFSQMLANSPAGQLFFKDGGRTQMAVQSMARYFGAIEDVDEEPETFLDVMNEVAKISSGWNNAVKAKLMLDAKKRYDQYGSAIDKDVTHTEVWAQALGFGTADTRDLYRLSMSMSKDVKAHREETLKVYNDIKRYYSEKLQVENSDPKFITKVTGRVMKVFENDPVAMQIITGQLKNDLSGKDQGLLNLMMKRADIPNPRNFRDQIKQAPVSDEDKQLMLQRVDDMEALRTDKKDK